MQNFRESILRRYPARVDSAARATPRTAKRPDEVRLHGHVREPPLRDGQAHPRGDARRDQRPRLRHQRPRAAPLPSTQRSGPTGVAGIRGEPRRHVQRLPEAAPDFIECASLDKSGIGRARVRSVRARVIPRKVANDLFGGTESGTSTWVSSAPSGATDTRLAQGQLPLDLGPRGE